MALNVTTISNFLPAGKKEKLLDRA